MIAEYPAPYTCVRFEDAFGDNVDGGGGGGRIQYARRIRASGARANTSPQGVMGEVSYSLMVLAVAFRSPISV